MPTDGSVCVAWVHSTDVSYSFFSSMLNLQGEFIGGDRRGRWLALRYGSEGIVGARNQAVQDFLAGDDEWLFWVDTDMGFTVEDFDKVMAAADADERPVVGGLCFANREVAVDGRGGWSTFPIPTIYVWAKQPDGASGFVSWHEYPKDDVTRCDATGSAFIVIHRSVLERIQAKSGDNWYQLMANPNPDKRPFSEDMSFCIRCAEHDIPIHVHTGARTTHHKPIWLSELHFDMHKAMAEAKGSTSQIESGGAKLKPKNRAERRRRDRAKAS